MKIMTPKQRAELGLLSMSLTLPRGKHGYLDLFTQFEQPQPVAESWLAQLEPEAPGVTEKFWKIVNS